VSGFVLLIKIVLGTVKMIIMIAQMDTGMLRYFESSKTHLGRHGAIKTRRIVAANPALFQQFNTANILANSLPFVQLDR